jgi:hypothetical protein
MINKDIKYFLFYITKNMIDDDSTKNIIHEMQEVEKNYYNDNSGKNVFFKSNQKTQIAKSIINNFELPRLLTECIYILESKNEIYINYPVLKMFIHDDIHEKIIQHILSLYNECILKHGKYSINMNLEGFSISAAERHKNAVILFSQRCFDTKEFKYVDLVEKIRIFNTPSVIDTLIKMFKPLFGKNLYKQIELYKKNESVSIMKEMGIN